jgi:hypothetical protein
MTPATAPTLPAILTPAPTGTWLVVDGGARVVVVLVPGPAVTLGLGMLVVAGVTVV